MIFSDRLMTNLQLIISQKDIRRLAIVDNKGQMVGFIDVFRVLWMANRWKNCQMIRILEIYVCHCVFFRQKRFRLTASMVGKRIKNGQDMYLKHTAV